MKKIILVLSLVLALGLGSMFVYASETQVITEEEKEANEWFEERMEFRRDQLLEAKNNGEITEKEYGVWSEHITEMEEFHEENGFINGGGFGAGCNGGRRGSNGFGGGFGGGMMRGGFNGFNNN